MHAPQFVRYREGSHLFIALVTTVRDDSRVNLAVFTRDGSCVGRTGIAYGDGPGQCKPLEVEALSAQLVEGAPLLEGIERVLVEMRAKVEQLEAGANALTSLVAEKLEALVRRVAELEVKLAEPAKLPDQPPPPAE